MVSMQFVNTLSGRMWYLDGHHETLAERSCEIPAELKFLSGYNKPESHKHRKRHAESLTESLLTERSVGLLNLTEISYMKADAWVGLRAVIRKLATNLRKYAAYLEHQCEMSNSHHQNKRSTFAFGNTNGAGPSSGYVHILEPKFTSEPTLTARYKPLADALADTEDFKPVCVNTFAPVSPWRKYEYFKAMTLPVRVVKFTHTSACQNIMFLWKVPASTSASDLLNKSTEIRESLLPELPVYHTRAMRSEFIHSFGKVTGCKSVFLHEAYCRLTGDKSAAHDSSEAEVDKRVAELLDLQTLLDSI